MCNVIVDRVYVQNPNNLFAEVYQAVTGVLSDCVVLQDGAPIVAMKGHTKPVYTLVCAWLDCVLRVRNS